MRYRQSAVAAEGGNWIRDLFARQVVPLTMFGLMSWLVYRFLAGFELAPVLDAAAAIHPRQWMFSVLAASGSYWFYGRFEATVHRLMPTKVPESRARIGAVASVALSQVTGFGLLTGTLARWRIFPELSVWQSMRLTVATSISFMLCLALLAASLTVFSNFFSPLTRILSFAALLSAIAAVLASVWRPRVLVGLHFDPPPLRALARLIAFAAADTALACLALSALLPDETAVEPLAFYAVFTSALFTGLLGTTPGGVGPFEFLLLAGLPAIPNPELLAAVAGFRLVYFLLPALFALPMLAVAPSLRRDSQQQWSVQPIIDARIPPIKAQALAYTAHRAEAGLMRQGAFELLCDNGLRPISMVAATGQSLLMLSDPLQRNRTANEALSALEHEAAERLRVPCIYKCGRRTAQVARARGWIVLPVSDEAWLNPTRFDLDTPAMRQVRRQIRKAEKAEVTIINGWGAAVPLVEMRRLANSRANDRKPARGFSMGRFCSYYVSAQRCHLAYHRGKLVAFLTFHEGHDERTLDLVVHGSDAPQGTMHLLVLDAIRQAKSEGCERLSLAAVPRDWPAPEWLASLLRRISGAEGLRRFKASFDPTWETLYMAAPDRFALGLATIDLIDRITRPREDLARS